MPRVGTAAALAGMIEKLQAQRKEYAAKLAEIDAIFARCGIQPLSAPASRAPAAAPVGDRRRTRRKFKVTANELILAFVKERGSATTAEINEHWRRNGRAGKADNTISSLVKEGKLKRKKLPGERGSSYSVA